MSAYSKTCVKNEIQSKKYESKELLVQEINRKITDLIERWRDQQLSKLSSHQNEDGKYSLRN